MSEKITLDHVKIYTDSGRTIISPSPMPMTAEAARFIANYCLRRPAEEGTAIEGTVEVEYVNVSGMIRRVVVSDATQTHEGSDRA